MTNGWQQLAVVFAASGLAANGFAQRCFAAAFPLFGVQSKFGSVVTRKHRQHVWLTLVYGSLHGHCITELTANGRRRSLRALEVVMAGSA